MKHHIDPRLAILARASALHDLVEADMMPLEEAFGKLIEAIDKIIKQLPPCPREQPCPCEREILERMEAADQRQKNYANERK